MNKWNKFNYHLHRWRKVEYVIDYDVCLIANTFSTKIFKENV